MAISRQSLNLNLSIMKKTHFGRGIILLLLISICTLGFNSTPKTNSVKSSTLQLINPEDMQQGGYYYFWDHGSGASVAQFDRMENDNIYTTYSITPLQLLFSQNAVFSVYDAGDIQPASLLQILHLQQCILLGRYIP